MLSLLKIKNYLTSLMALKNLQWVNNITFILFDNLISWGFLLIFSTIAFPMFLDDYRDVAEMENDMIILKITTLSMVSIFILLAVVFRVTDVLIRKLELASKNN